MAIAVLLLGWCLNIASAQPTPPETAPPAVTSDPQDAAPALTVPGPMIVEPAAANTAALEPEVEAPMTKPILVDASKINSGDTAWLLTSTALVLFMTIPGLALFYAGMVRKKNVLTTMAHSSAVTCPGHRHLGGHWLQPGVHTRLAVYRWTGSHLVEWDGFHQGNRPVDR